MRDVSSWQTFPFINFALSIAELPEKKGVRNESFLCLLKVLFCYQEKSKREKKDIAFAFLLGEGAL
jgi:hypothetical protein